MNLRPEELKKTPQWERRANWLKSLPGWWKRYFGYSSNDPRWLTATLSQIVGDYWEAIVGQEPQLPESSPEFEEWRKKVREDPGYFKQWQAKTAKMLGFGKKKEEK